MSHTKLREFGFQVTKLTHRVSEVSFRGTSVTLSDVPGYQMPIVGGHPDHIRAFDEAISHRSISHVDLPSLCSPSV